MLQNTSKTFQLIIQQALGGELSAIQSLAHDAEIGFPVLFSKDSGKGHSNCSVHQALYETNNAPLWRVVLEQIIKDMYHGASIHNDIFKEWITDAAKYSDYTALKTLLIDWPHTVGKKLLLDTFFKDEIDRDYGIKNKAKKFRILYGDTPTTSPLIKLASLPTGAKDMRTLLSIIGDAFMIKDDNGYLVSDVLFATSIFHVWTSARNKPGVLQWCEEQCAALYSRWTVESPIDLNRLYLFIDRMFANDIFSCLGNLPISCPNVALDEYIHLAGYFSDKTNTFPHIRFQPAVVCIHLIKLNFEHLQSNLKHLAWNPHTINTEQCNRALSNINKINHLNGKLAQTSQTSADSLDRTIMTNIESHFMDICKTLRDDDIIKKPEKATLLLKVLLEVKPLLLKPTTAQAASIDLEMSRISRLLLRLSSIRVMQNSNVTSRIRKAL